MQPSVSSSPGFPLTGSPCLGRCADLPHGSCAPPLRSGARSLVHHPIGVSRPSETGRLLCAPGAPASRHRHLEGGGDPAAVARWRSSASRLKLHRRASYAESSLRESPRLSVNARRGSVPRTRVRNLGPIASRQTGRRRPVGARRADRFRRRSWSLRLRPHRRLLSGRHRPGMPSGEPDSVATRPAQAR